MGEVMNSTMSVAEARKVIKLVRVVMVKTIVGASGDGVPGWFEVTPDRALRELDMYSADEQVFCKRCYEKVYLGAV